MFRKDTKMFHHKDQKSPTGPPAPAIQTNLPNRQFSGASTSTPLSEDDAVPTGDPMNTSDLLAERLQAWKHAVGYLEAYITATEKVERSYAKETEKVLKTIVDPLREGHHFDQSLGGLAGLLENMRANTQGIINSHLETEKNLKGSVLPILERLHKEIKNKSKELATGVLKTAKEVEKARNTTQKHIELLGTETATFGSTGGKIASQNDPYVLQRGVYHRLSKQILEENNLRQDTISVQINFQTFEAHIIEVIQQALASFNQFVGGQAQRDQSMYADMLATAQRIPPDFEWNGFVNRRGDMLIDPNGPTRSVQDIQFANQNHAATQPLIEGTLERKSRSVLSSGYSTGYYVVTPTGYLHEFKDNDNLRKDPTPDLSIYLPEAVIGSTNGAKFNVKGKDVSKGLSAKLSGNHEIAFKAHTAEDAEKWFAVISSAAGSSPVPYASAPGSPIESRHNTLPAEGGIDNKIAGGQNRVPSTGTIPPQYENNAAQARQPGMIQTQGITGGQTVTSPTSAGPQSAGVVHTPVQTSAVDHATGEKI